MVLPRSAARALLTNQYVLFFGLRYGHAQRWSLKASWDDRGDRILGGCPLGDI
jgi:hypothetical protein